MKKRKQNKKIWLIGVLFLLLLIITGISFGGSIREVQVFGCKYYTEDEIKDKVMNSVITRNSLGLYATYAGGKKPDIPFVERIVVELNGFHSVSIIVCEKTVIGCIPYMSEYLYFDKDGVIVESSPEHKEGIPVIEGVNFTKMNLHEPLEVDEPAIFQQIMSVSQLLGKYQIATDKVYFDLERKVTLYVGGITVKLGKKDVYDQAIAELSNMLPKAKKKKLEGEIDMENYQVGQGSIILKQKKKEK